MKLGKLVVVGFMVCLLFGNSLGWLDKITSGLKKGIDGIGDLVKDPLKIAETAIDITKDLGNAVGNVVENGIDKAKDATKDITKTVGNVIDKGTDKTNDVSKFIFENVGSAAETAIAMTNDLGESVGNVVKNGIDKAKDATEDIRETAENVIDKANDVGKDMVERVGGDTTNDKGVVNLRTSNDMSPASMCRPFVGFPILCLFLLINYIA